jgi:aspartate kinase
VLSVIKLGGSVLRTSSSYAEAARFLQRRLVQHDTERLVVIVSARHGETDALLAEAQVICAEPPDPARDLLWCTGELRSVALLTLHLEAIGVMAVPFNVHQTGLIADRIAGTTVQPRRLLAALATCRVLIAPGFLGVRPDDSIASLGRGGSDLTAVLLAAAIRADACELIKDVPGYFTADPHRDVEARPIHDLSIGQALAMADRGCDLVQRAALIAAASSRIQIVVRSMDAAAPVTHLRSQHHGIRYENDSRSAALGA